jgi:DinB superfamily
MEDLRFPIGKFTPPAGFTQSFRQECLIQIEEAPERLREAVKRLTAEQLQTPYREGGWTIAQVVHHVPDSHMNAYVRIRLALTDDEPKVADYNEVRWAELSDAGSSDVEGSLLLLEGLHRRWVSLLRRLSPEQFARAYVHPVRGLQTIDRALALYSWHGRHHVAHITSLRGRMGW